ncbi:MAG: hypothetical protein IPQ07_33030 [Myxococcales bacterium]|nr:hypothetical protein [Myxococcales bacterium]
MFWSSFVLDCADGMLARPAQDRLVARPSADFLMDELKAMLLLGAVTVRVAGERW